MSTGSVDERIRTVLDLGDSSAAVKGLDAEVEKLLDAFKKQTELFEQKKLTPQAYADALHKMKSEVAGLSGAMKELGASGSGGGGEGFEGINRRLFALERGVTGLVSGTGLGRAGSALEGGIGLLGGPAGLGIMAALVMNTLEHIGPAIKTGFDKLFKGITDEEITERRAALKEEAKQVRAAVTAQEIKPEPGLEYQQADRDAKLRSIFTGKVGPDSIARRLKGVIATHRGATITDQQPEETEALNRLKDQLDPASAVERQSTMPYERIVEYWKGAIERVQQGMDPKRREGIKEQIRKLQSTVSQRTADKLVLAAQEIGPAGRTARRQLLELAHRFPGTLDPDDMTKLDDIIKQEDPKRIKDELEKLQEKNAKAEALEYKGPPPPTLDKVYPDHAKNLQAPRLQTGIIPGAQEAADQRKRDQTQGAGPVVAGPPSPSRYTKWPRRMGSGPSPRDFSARQYSEALEYSERTAMGIDSRPYSPRHPRKPPPAQAHPGAAKPRTDPLAPPTGHSSQEEFQAWRQRMNVEDNRKYKEYYLKEITKLQRALADAVKYGQTHAGATEKTQQVVNAIQQELVPLKQQVAQLNKNANDLRRQQQKSAQTTGGNP